MIRLINKPEYHKVLHLQLVVNFLAKAEWVKVYLQPVVQVLDKTQFRMYSWTVVQVLDKTQFRMYSWAVVQVLDKTQFRMKNVLNK